MERQVRTKAEREVDPTGDEDAVEMTVRDDDYVAAPLALLFPGTMMLANLTLRHWEMFNSRKT